MNRFGCSTCLFCMATILLTLISVGATAQCLAPDTQVQDSCGSVTSVGCCGDANSVRYCSNGVLCQKSCQPDFCQWSSTGTTSYTCGPDGGTSDPDGIYARTCPCVPACTGKACGDDGCGQTCGSCKANENCVDDQCQCVPDCRNRECGDDGYGNSCGSCTDASQWGCNNGTCVCTPKCEGRQCGADGCGKQCGTCGNGQICVGTQCIDKPCNPVCFERVCGDDKCGGLCGKCPQGKSCEAFSGQCQTGVCTPDCSGKECGDDGCGQLCDSCTLPSTCNSSFKCVDVTCKPACTGKNCGDDGCGDVCGTCVLPAECDASGKCAEPCSPVCEGRSCGDNSCGGSCGACGEGFYCDGSFACVAGTAPDADSDIDTSADVATGDRPAGGDGTSNDRTGPDAGTCPAGTTEFNGQCIPAVISAKGGGCSTGGGTAGSLLPFILAVAGMALAFRRRKSVRQY